MVAATYRQAYLAAAKFFQITRFLVETKKGDKKAGSNVRNEMKNFRNWFPNLEAFWTFSRKLDAKSLQNSYYLC